MNSINHRIKLTSTTQQQQNTQNLETKQQKQKRCVPLHQYNVANQALVDLIIFLQITITNRILIKRFHAQ
jgi:uncharacterized metal-binding protein